MHLAANIEFTFFSELIFPSIFNYLYRDGTTDVTRTVHLGTPNDHQKVPLIIFFTQSKFI